MSRNNALWQFLASVPLALVTISLITVTSILGTVIPQNQPASWYVSRYGPEMARFFELLDLTDMYGSWWFSFFLILLVVNLIVCSLDRLPGVFRQINSDGLSFKPERLAKSPIQHHFELGSRSVEAAALLSERLRDQGWEPRERETDNGTVLFAQKGGWTRAGVYLVHTSILVILLGAAIGYFGGFKGSITIPETMERDGVVLRETGELKPLGFTVRCNSFTIEFYPNGMPKEYTSSLTVIEDGTEVVTTDIEVNKPLKYRGITFYQSSYEREFLVRITPENADNATSFIVPFQQQETWPEENLRFGILNARSIGQSIISVKLWFSDNLGDPFTGWVDAGEELVVSGQRQSYRLSAKQLYATGLQVARDPGVWWVYAGFTLMLVGLYVAFFMSHRRIWLQISPKGEAAEVTLYGSANKNHPGFRRQIQAFLDRIETATPGQ